MNPAPFQYTLYRIVAPLAVLALVLLLAAAWSGRRRARPAATAYCLFTVATIGYLAANFLEISSHSAEASMFWSRAIYPFIVFIPMLWLEFCLRFSRDGRGLSRIGMLLLLTVPAVTLVFVFSDRLSGLIWQEIRFFPLGGYILSTRSHGPWFFAYAIYTYSLTLAGAFVLLRTIALYRARYRKQAVFVILGILVPLAASFVYVLKLIPGLTKDLTPLAYAASCVSFYFAVFRFDLFSLAPAARGLVVERMRDGILVIDSGGRLADANPAALRLLGLGEDSIGSSVLSIEESPAGRGTPRRTALPGELVAIYREPGAADFALDRHGKRLWIRAEAFRLGGRSKEGIVIVIRDETNLRELLDRVERLARTDELTGMYNRRSFLEGSSREFSRARRGSEPLAAVMADLDDFKSINDQYGHAAGDRVLRCFAEILAGETRGEDLAGRMGGDEFAVVVVGSGIGGARSFCERVAALVASSDLDGEGPPRFSASFGVAEYDSSCESIEELLSRADAALYRAKTAGKARIIS